MWLPPIACTVIGASHQRKGKLCQDASLSSSFISKDGEELHLMVVSDGHGGERYWLSDVGSRLACEEAAKAVEAAVKKYCLDDQAKWQHMLAEELPKAIHSQWLDAIHQDWKNQEKTDLEEFCSQLYGCTLGLVLMAPQWWGHTGLGDWDLVTIQDGKAELVSEEKDLIAACEATASLSMANAGQQFKSRCNLLPIDQAQSGIHLLMSTDGIRKSCATDEDFLALCIYFADLNKADEIGQALSEITSQGSGDDVSVAISTYNTSASNSLETANSAHARSRSKGRDKDAMNCKPLITAVALSAFAAFAWKNLTDKKIPTSLPNQERKTQAVKANTSLPFGSPVRITKSPGQD